MKKLITILGAGLLAFGMFTSCGAKDVNLSWSEESTSYNYECDITALTINQIDDPVDYDDEQARKNPTTSVSSTYTPKYATVSWYEGYSNFEGDAYKGNKDYYTITLNYSTESTTTNIASSNVVGHYYSPNDSFTFRIKKVGDKYFIDPSNTSNPWASYIPGATLEPTEVTFDGDPTDDEFTFSADVYVVQYVNDWKADGSANYYKGDTQRVKRAVKTGVSFSNVTIERK